MLKSRLFPRHILCGALLGVVCLIAPLQAQAACSSSDISAKWQTYFKIVDGTGALWLKCKVKVNSSGAVVAGKSCRVESPFGSASASTTGGSLSVASNCEVTGTIQVSGCDLVLQGATMSKDGQKIAGVGSDCGSSGLEVFDMTAVKR
jgi:hypothetical protein